MTKPPYRVALTGGIASGKTTVANLFAELGVPVIDTDVIARTVVEPGQPALAAVIEAFGRDVLDADGHLDRRRMRERIFSDRAAQRRLEGILHPAIREEMERLSREAGCVYQILVIPLLTEGGRRDHIDRVLLVDVPEEVQVERLVARDGVTRVQARAALAAQASRSARSALADDTVQNSGRVDELRAKVAQFDALYRRLAAQRPA